MTIHDPLDDIDWSVDPAVDRAQESLAKARSCDSTDVFVYLLDSIASSLIAIARKAA